MTPKSEIINHYNAIWHNKPTICRFDQGPVEKFESDFCILEYKPNTERNMWTYATCNMGSGIELHIFSAKEDKSLIELLTAITFYHRTKAKLDIHHTINFGRSWQDNSKCTHGLISLPYLDGPELEKLQIENETIGFYWLIPVTADEVSYKAEKSIDALEERFDDIGLDYLNPDRQSVIL